MTTAALELRCPRCPSKQPVDRYSEDPPSAVVGVIICPKCHDGELHEIVYYDAKGEQVHA